MAPAFFWQGLADTRHGAHAQVFFHKHNPLSLI
jgi:hypothetical protein